MNFLLLTLIYSHFSHSLTSLCICLAFSQSCSVMAHFNEASGSSAAAAGSTPGQSPIPKQIPTVFIIKFDKEVVEREKQMASQAS